MATLLSDRPVQHITNNTLTFPSTISDFCITPNCPNVLVYGPYNKDYTKSQIDRQELGMKLFKEHLQPQLNPYIEVLTSNTRPAYPNYMNYVKY